MKKLIFTLLITGLLIFISPLVLAFKVGPYEVEYLDEKLDEFVPEGWRIYHINVKYLDSMKSSPTEKEYIVALFTKAYFDSNYHWDEYITKNQINIFQWQGDNLELVWNSETYIGRFGLFNYQDIDNNGLKNINVEYLTKKDEQITKSLIIYDWNNANPKKVYPLSGFQRIETDYGFDFSDFNNDGFLEIKTEKVLQEEPYRYRNDYYVFKDGQLIHEKEFISEVKEKPENKLITQYPLINKIVEQNTSGELTGVTDLGYDNLYLVRYDLREYEWGYLIVQKEGENVHFKYLIDERLNNTGVCMGELNGDLNKDGYLEIVFHENGSEEYYIVSLRPNQPLLISPVTDQFRSKIWMLVGRQIDEIEETIRLEDIDHDGIDEIVAEDMVYLDVVVVYWKWDPEQESYILYQRLIWDEEAGEYKLFDENE